jgi:membrane associated rhomboid family serine protease
MRVREFMVHAQIDGETLQGWIKAGWLAPQWNAAGADCSEIDLARPPLIADLQRLGVNSEGIPIILDLIDQLHGLRRMARASRQGQSAAAGEVMIPITTAVPSRYPPVITWTLIAINCAVFLMQTGMTSFEEQRFVMSLALIPARYTGALAGGDLSPAQLVPFVTMMFLHGGWLHIIFNMWTLWLFGPTVEDRLGHGRFLAFYLICGIGAGVAHVIFNPTSTVPVLGASGAIAGVLGCFMRMFPLARVVVLVPVIIIPFFFEVPAFVFIGLWFLLQVLQGTMELLLSSAGGGIAWWAHVGGFVVGLVLLPLSQRAPRDYRAYYPDEGILGFDPSGQRTSAPMR